MDDRKPPAIGDRVLFAVGTDDGSTVTPPALAERAATIVRVWPSDTHGANLMVELDGNNDRALLQRYRGNYGRLDLNDELMLASGGRLWATSIARAADDTVAELGKWRPIPRVG